MKRGEEEGESKRQKGREKRQGRYRECYKTGCFHVLIDNEVSLNYEDTSYAEVNL